MLPPGHWSPHDNGTWLADSCVYYRWSAAEARRCLAKRSVVFLGGAYTRNLFRCVAELVGADALRCDNFATSHLDLRLALSAAPRQAGAPTFELVFYWNPLISWADKWCHTGLCVRHDGAPPPDVNCACPPVARLGAPLSYTGERVRAPFLRELLADGVKPDFIVTSYGIGDVDNAAFIQTLSAAPTIVVGYNPTHAIHQHDGVADSPAKVLDFSTLTRNRPELMRQGHPSSALLHTIVHNVLSTMSETLCTYERKFLSKEVRTE